MSIPGVEHRFLDAAGRVDVVWRRFLQNLGPVTDIEELEAAVAALQDALAAIGTPRDVIGQYSIQAIPGDGAYYLHLLGDTEEPGPTYYYGTGPDGLKGWYALTAEAVPYDNATSGLAAENVQAAIDEVVANASQGVPYEVVDGAVYSVPAGTQALFTIPIDLLGTGSIDLSGALVEVS
jgi:hypothetical protein